MNLKSNKDFKEKQNVLKKMKSWSLVGEKLIILSFAFILSLDCAIAQHPVWLGSAFPGPVFSLAVNNNYLYTGEGSMFTVYDITNPQNPVYKGHCHTSDCITYISSFNNKCYAGNNGMGITELNVSNSSDPYVERYLYTNLVAGYNPAIDNNIGFFPMGSSGLWAVNIGNNDSLPFTQWGNIPATHDFCIDVVKKDSMLYASDRLNGIYILKYKNNTLSQISNHTFSSYWAMECETDETNNFLYVTGYRVASGVPISDTLSLWVFDIHDASNFQLIGTYKHAPIPSYPLDLKVKNNIAYIAAWGDGIIMVDVSNPQSMHQAGVIPTADASNWIDMKDTVAWVADLSAGFKSVLVSDTANLVVLYKNDTLGDTYGIAKSGNYLYTSIKTKGLEIAYNNSGILSEKAFIPMAATIYAPLVKDSLLFIPAWDKGVIVYNISNPEQPDSLTCIKHSGDNGAISIHISNGQMVVAEATYYLGLWRICNIYVWDISQLLSPVLLGSKQFLTLSTPYDLPVYNIDRHNNLVALTQWHDVLSGNFWLFDISNPQNIIITDSVSNSYASDVKIFESGVDLYAAVAVGSAFPQVENGLEIYNISNPAIITESSFYYAGNTGNRLNGLDILSSQYAVTAEGGVNSKGTMRIINISDPSNPFISDSIYIGSNTSNNHVKIDGNFIYHSSGSTGLMLFSWNPVTGIIEHPDNSGNLKIFPNPFNTSATLQFTNSKNENLTLIIYNAKGQVMQKIKNISCNKITLENGNWPSGLYFFKLQDKNGTVGQGKFIIE